MITIQRLPLSSLHPAEKNVRRHTDKQIAEYIRSLNMFDQVKPLVVDGEGEIICGNGLYAALVAMGRTECDCYVRDDLTPAQKKKLMLADNRVYELGITSIDTFEEIIRELGEDTDVPGWDVDLLSALTATTPDVDDVVASYGNFDTDDTDRIRRLEQRPPEANQTPAPAYQSAGYAYQSPDMSQERLLQQTPSTFQPHTPVSDRPAAPTQEGAFPAHTERYVICPKCGERICL